MNEERLLPIEEIIPGDLMVVLPGEKIPTDGMVEAGPVIGGRVDADRRVVAR